MEPYQLHDPTRNRQMTGREARDKLYEFLRRELMGPAPYGAPLDINQPISFQSWEEAAGPWVQQDTGEEILWRDPPLVRYSVGVLFPRDMPRDEVEQELEEAAEEWATSEAPPPLSRNHGSNSRGDIDQVSSDPLEEDEEGDISLSRYRQPSSMGISLLARLRRGSRLVVTVTGGQYSFLEAQVMGQQRAMYLRRPVTLLAEAGPEDIAQRGIHKLVPAASETHGLELEVLVTSRPMRDDQYLLTVSLVNNTPYDHPGSDEYRRYKSERCLFQSSLEVEVRGDGDSGILPYPSRELQSMVDDEEESIRLLYRKHQIFGVGHGCAADWELDPSGERARKVMAECMPKVEVPSVTPDIRLEDGSLLEIPMAPLAGLVPGDDGLRSLERMLDLYARWIADRKREIETLEDTYQEAAYRHMEECERCLARMREGLRYLQENTMARRAFQLANRAMLLQQITSRRPTRAATITEDNRLQFRGEYVPPDPASPGEGIGRWRPFQAAFILMNLRSIAEGNHPDRETVELIWFPTGGGKTEAYLGLTAFSLFLRRLRDPEDCGVHVIMRYTLRLLTTQQFQRASSLILAMEKIRRENPAELGQEPFSIGIWLGQSTTPNTRKDAVSSLGQLQRSDKSAENPFLLQKCPWCGAQMGPIDQGNSSRRRGNNTRRVLGYERIGNTVAFCCPDKSCEFSDRLPIYVIDEDIYEFRPSLVIGTVDKFAMLAWRPEARALFGLDDQGQRILSPPGLIIQDELHLISGPLGSMVGLFEAVIEDLCTDRRGAQPIKPKIISSTATVRRHKEQIKALYNRDRVTLFPSPGLEVNESFFSSIDRMDDGSLAPGRMYVGVFSPGTRSLVTTSVRTFGSLLQASYELPEDKRDPWWTLMIFYNSLRELGTGLSLFDYRIGEYMKAMNRRRGRENSTRFIYRNRVIELTSRIRNDQVPQALEELARRYSPADERSDGVRALDACLASNIIEVGIDVERLSLMAVVCQPKATAQYIQVTGRVGRRWRDQPGLVVVLYNPARPRDRSHFEHFRAYHERLYAQIEPMTLTPFSQPAMERSLHAALVAYVRQYSRIDQPPSPVPEDLIASFRSLVRERVRSVDPDELPALEKILEMRLRQWRAWEPEHWEVKEDDPGLMYRAGEYIDPEIASISWEVQQSMRSVDAECRLRITYSYIKDQELSGSNILEVNQ